MPYVDKGSRICKPNYNLDVKSGDIVLTYPALVKVNKNLIVYPPLSKISDECKDEIESPLWVDGYEIRGDEQIKIVNENPQRVKGEIEIKCPKVLTAYTLKKILGVLEISVSQTNHVGNSLVTINNFPLISIQGEKVIVYTSERIPILLAFAYSLFYYMRSSSEFE